TAEINIPSIASSHINVTITAVAFSSLGNVMPARNRTDDLNTTENVINGLIVVVNTRWDSAGCEVIQVNGNVTCSILMSPFAPEDLALSVITHVGVAISLASLVVAVIVKPGTDYTNSCSTAVFFTHFFYLPLFFWMLVSAVLLLYRTTMVFHISKSVMMALAFIAGYGAPLLISVITVASTAGNKHYVTWNEACWLNCDQSKALLAFVLPALVIVAVNIIIVIIVVVKMLRRGVGESNRDEKNTLVVILRCEAILMLHLGSWLGHHDRLMGTSIVQNIFFCVQQKEEIHTGLKQLEGE
uniref:G-protein coupled receptors family 2 profile 2 domain-containing protein n=1 Tax=Sinocyclocheilus anshuiensis TaxID=1608454 RepID=A0A671SXW6_9TELE